MKKRTTTILYWGLTTLFCLMMLLDGGAGLAHEHNGVVAMQHLGYPVYLMSILGVAKILGALALLQPKYRTLKEWAFAGFTINFIGAAASHLLAGDGIPGAIAAFVMLAVLFGLYFLWKQHRAHARHAAETSETTAVYAAASAAA
ncbi:MAG: DoxX family protein [Hymenobacter sp.]|jgi:uncharacterized membrane protein|nr:DoxX family protein [Hymenobacter sp.]